MTCNLAKVPSHAVVTNKGNSNKASYVSALLRASQMYGNDSGNFTLFDSKTKYGKKDLLFKDSTVELIDVSDKTYLEFLGDDYVNVLKGLKDCVGTDPTNGGKSTVTDPTNGGKGTGIGPTDGGNDSNNPYFLAFVLLALVALVLSGTAE